MYYHLIAALKRRLILELQDSFSQHPVYAKIVPFVQNKYSFKERPQFGIVVKGSSANKVQLSGDNFMGTVNSHVMLTGVGAPAYPLEWVREDLRAVQVNEGVFPLAPGIYYIEILTVPEDASGTGSYVIDPLLTAANETVLQFRSGIEREAQLQNIPVKGTVRLYERNRNLLKEGRDFTVNYQDGSITLLARFTPNTFINADYSYAAPSLGPFNFQWNTSDFAALPGVVLAFGKRAQVGDKVAVVVYNERVDTAQAYGGKNEVTFEFDIITQNTDQMEEIADLCIMYLWGVKKPLLEAEGIEIVDISMGGETEETYDETGDLWFYNASMSIQFRADWEIHVPLPLTLSRVSPVTQDGKNGIVSQGPNSLFFQTVPVLIGRNNNFERVT